MRNSRNVTAAEIAETLKLSRTTVSVVLSGQGKANRIADKTMQRIWAAARELNYRPNAAAQQLRGKRSNVIGVLVTSELMIDLRLIAAMELIAAERGIRFMVGHAVGSPDRVREYLHDFRSRGVDGVFSFFLHHPKHRVDLLTELLKFENVVYYEKPTDAAGHTPPNVCYVGPDFLQVGRIGVQHLIDSGRRRIGLVLRELFFPYAIERRRAYEMVLAENNYTCDDNLVWVMTDRTGRQWTDPLTPDLALDVVDDLVVNRGADAIVAVNDLYATSMVYALRKRGFRVPDDVAVIGCDNLELGPFIDPPLTTVDLELEQLARALMGMMFDLLGKREIPPERRGVLVRPELIVRESS